MLVMLKLCNPRILQIKKYSYYPYTSFTYGVSQGSAAKSRYLNKNKNTIVWYNIKQFKPLAYSV